MEESILSIPFVMGGTKILPSSLHRKWREPKLQQSTTKSSLKLCSCLVSSVIWPCITTRNFLPCMQSQLHTYASDIGNAWLNRRAELFCSQVRVSGNPGTRMVGAAAAELASADSTQGDWLLRLCRPSEHSFSAPI